MIELLKAIDSLIGIQTFIVILCLAGIVFCFAMLHLINSK